MNGILSVAELNQFGMILVMKILRKFDKSILNLKTSKKSVVQLMV